jgi:catechol 2,3-dioxygenase-like lactoylglutathione lyase family enzyme
MQHSVQMVMLTAPDVVAAARFYADHLAFRITSSSDDEVIVEGYGMQIVLTPGPGGKHVEAPSPAQAAIEIPATMQRIEGVWDRDRQRDATVLGPMLDPSGAFVYVTLDPARNAVALVSPLPSEREEVRMDRVTQRLKRPDFG